MREEISLRFIRRLLSVLKKLNQNYEIIFIDDGSTDGTLNQLRQACKEDPSTKVISFLRNYGQTAALSAGIDFSKGSIIVPDGRGSPERS